MPLLISFESSITVYQQVMMMLEQVVRTLEIPQRDTETPCPTLVVCVALLCKILHIKNLAFKVFLCLFIG